MTVAAELVSFAPAFISVSFTTVQMTATQLNDSLGLGVGGLGGGGRICDWLEYFVVTL